MTIVDVASVKDDMLRGVQFQVGGGRSFDLYWMKDGRVIRSNVCDGYPDDAVYSDEQLAAAIASEPDVFRATHEAWRGKFPVTEPDGAHVRAVEMSITIIATRAEDPDQFEGEMTLEKRREDSGGWRKLGPVRSGRLLDTFVMKAADADLSVFDSAERLVDDDGVAVHTCMIDRESVRDHVVADLEALIEQAPEATARALVAHGGGTADPARVLAALASGTWPESGDPAEEAAAFAFHLLAHARRARELLMGVCWELRGVFRV